MSKISKEMEDLFDRKWLLWFDKWLLRAAMAEAKIITKDLEEKYKTQDYGDWNEDYDEYWARTYVEVVQHYEELVNKKDLTNQTIARSRCGLHLIQQRVGKETLKRGWEKVMVKHQAYINIRKL